MKLSLTLILDIKITSLLIMAQNSTLETDTQDTFLQEAGTYMTFKVAKFIDSYYFPVFIPFRVSW